MLFTTALLKRKTAVSMLCLNGTHFNYLHFVHNKRKMVSRFRVDEFVKVEEQLLQVHSNLLDGWKTSLMVICDYYFYKFTFHLFCLFTKMRIFLFIISNLQLHKLHFIPFKTEKLRLNSSCPPCVNKQSNSVFQ